MGNIDWIPIADLPDALKDGRDVLLCRKNTLGTYYGGDGEKLNPDRPFLYDLACWENGQWRTETDDGCGGSEMMRADDPDYFAELNPPA